MGGEPATSRWTRISRGLDSIRVRATGAAVLVVGVTLVVASIAMLTVLERSLRENVRTTAESRAEVIARDLARSATSERIAVEDQDDEFVQVLDADGDAVMASANLSNRPALVVLQPGESRIVGSVPFEDGSFLAVGVAASVANGQLTVVLGRSLETVVETHREVAVLLAVGVPLVLVVVGFVTWMVAGRVLAPVDAIRREVEAISVKELHRRVPDPPGRDEIARLASTMNSMLERLEQAAVRERRFVSDASHELRSPVAAIRQHAEVALSHPDRATMGELAETVLEEDVRLQRIVEDLLMLTRVDEGTLRLRRLPVDLDDLMFEEAARLRAATALRIDSAGVSAGRVVGDRGRLERLVRNLTDNAARHAASEIRLALRGDDGRVVLEVDDDGPGVPAEQRTAVFERFTRLDDARDRRHGGAGLGLAIVAEIAAAHGGSASVVDAPSGGARFLVVLPAGP